MCGDRQKPKGTSNDEYNYVYAKSRENSEKFIKKRTYILRPAAQFSKILFEFEKPETFLHDFVGKIFNKKIHEIHEQPLSEHRKTSSPAI